MSRPAPVPARLIVAAALLAGCGSTNSTSPGGGGGGAPAGPAFNLMFAAKGASASFTFADSGSWAYHCSVHQGLGMVGTVNVRAAGADSDTVDVGVDGAGNPAAVFTPAAVTVKPGGTVRWINRSNMVNHTVTRP